MYAIFETGGKQYKASKGDILRVEKLDLEEGKQLSFDALVIADGDDVKIGTPTVDGAKVRAKVQEHGKEKKVVVFKYKPKRKYRKKQGHRQPYTVIRITSISLAGSKDEEEPAETKAASVKTEVKKETAAAKTTTTAKKPAAKKPAAKTTAKKTETKKEA